MAYGFEDKEAEDKKKVAYSKKQSDAYGKMQQGFNKPSPAFEKLKSLFSWSDKKKDENDTEE